MKNTADVQSYQRFRIPKGTRYRTFHPQKTGEQVAGKTYVVLARTGSGPDTDEVRWAGSGGYWCRASKADVELCAEGQS